MDLLPKISSRYWQLKSVVVDAVVRLGIQRTTIVVSRNKLFLSMMYGVSTYKGTILGMFTTGREALACLREKDVGVVISTIELEDGSGDAFITQARLLQPSLRCVLVADHHHYQPEEALYWQSPVIVAADDVGHESEPWNQGLLAALTNTTYRSPSIASPLVDNGEASTIKLTTRERQMLECYALGLTNAQAAERLSLSPQSTKTYSRNLLSKLNVSNRQLALLKMMGRGFLPVKNSMLPS